MIRVWGFKTLSIFAIKKHIIFKKFLSLLFNQVKSYLHQETNTCKSKYAAYPISFHLYFLKLTKQSSNPTHQAISILFFHLKLPKKQEIKSTSQKHTKFSIPACSISNSNKQEHIITRGVIKLFT